MQAVRPRPGGVSDDSGMTDLLRLLAVGGLVAVNAFFVIAEYAVVTARRGPLIEASEGGSRRAAAALRLMDDPVRVISTVQVAITAVGILIGAIGEPLLNDVLGGGLPSPVGFVVAFGVVTYLTVVFGELVPKAVSLDRAEAIVRRIAIPIEFVGRLAHPLVWVLDGSARLVLRLFGIERVVAGRSVQTPSELRELVDEAEQSGVIPRAQEELLHRVFDFAAREAADVMVPAAEVSWLDAESSPERGMDAVIEGVHTRFPVGEGSLDRLIGVVHAREIAAAARAGSPATIRPLVREVLVVPPTKDLGALLRELRERREELAVVASEYGTTRGLLTIEDIVEQIVGDIENEYVLSDATVERLDAATVRVAGSMTIDDFNESEGTELPQDGPRTLAGLVFDRLGRAAEPGDRISVAGLELHVLEVDGARITRLQATDRRPRE